MTLQLLRVKIEELIKNNPNVVRLAVYDSHDTEISTIIIREPNVTSKDGLGFIELK